MSSISIPCLGPPSPSFEAGLAWVRAGTGRKWLRGSTLRLGFWRAGFLLNAYLASQTALDVAAARIGGQRLVILAEAGAK